MKKNTITNEHINKLISGATFQTFTAFDKCTVVAMKLPNGFVLVESSAAVDPENYDRELGVKLCKERLVKKVWELEGYKLQDRLYVESQPVRNVEDMTLGEMVRRGFNVTMTVDYNGRTNLELVDREAR